MYESRGGPQSWPRLFSGVTGDGYCLGKDRSGQIWWLCLLDLPFSLATDVVVSPYTAYQQIARGNYHARCVAQQREEIRAQNRRQLEAALELCRKDRARGIYNCPSMIARDGAVLVGLDGGPPCPEAR